MKAAQYDCYGPPEVIEIRDLPEPVPRAGEVQVRVIAAALNPKDVLTRAGKFWRMAGADFPKGSGFDFAGVIESVGPGVKNLRVGDPVFGMLNGWRARACAEKLVATPDEMAALPPALSFAEAASLPLVAQTALQALRDLGGVCSGSKVLIHGASGGVGTIAIQIAKALGAEVTALCGSTSLDLVKGLGADQVFDYRRIAPSHVPGHYDCFFDVFGNQSFAGVRRMLKVRGVYVSTVPSPRNVFDHVRTRLWPLRRARLVVVKSNTRDLETLAAWAAAGMLRPVIAARLPLADVRRGHEMIQTKRTHGKIVIEVAREPVRKPVT